MSWTAPARQRHHPIPDVEKVRSRTGLRENRSKDSTIKTNPFSIFPFDHGKQSAELILFGVLAAVSGRASKFVNDPVTILFRPFRLRKTQEPTMPMPFRWDRLKRQAERIQDRG